MDDDFSVPGLEPDDDGEQPPPPDPRDVGQVQQDRYAMPPESETEWESVDPDPFVPTYVGNEAPWVGIGSSMGESLEPSEEPEFTRIVRKRRPWKAAVAWSVTGVVIVAAAWFLPILLAPTSQLGRVGSYAALALGGLAILAVLWRTWRWTRRGE
jgi:hypothetical protein